MNLTNKMEQSSPFQGLQQTLAAFAGGQSRRRDSVLAFSQCLLDTVAQYSPAKGRQSPSSPSHPSPPDGVYKVRNLDTGQEVDLRDENKDNFVLSLARLLANEEYKEALEVF